MLLTFFKVISSYWRCSGSLVNELDFGLRGSGLNLARSLGCVLSANSPLQLLHIYLQISNENLVLNQDDNFYQISLSVHTTLLLDNVWILWAEVMCKSLMGVTGLTFTVRFSTQEYKYYQQQQIIRKSDEVLDGGG